MDTIVKGTDSTVVIGPGRPTVIIGNRCDPARNLAVRQAIEQQDRAYLQQEAKGQVDAGAHLVLVSAQADGLNEDELLPFVVESVLGVVSVPLCLVSRNPRALSEALNICTGKPLIAAVQEDKHDLEEMLPMLVQHEVAVLGTCNGVGDLPETIEERIEQTRHILRLIISAGVPRADILLDPGVQLLSKDPYEAINVLKAVSYLAKVDDINLAVKPEAISPSSEMDALVYHFIGLLIQAGATCLFLDPVQGCKQVRSVDTLLGRMKMDD